MKRREVNTTGANDWLAKLRLAYHSGELPHDEYLRYQTWFAFALESFKRDFESFGNRKLFKPSVRYFTTVDLHRPTTIWASLDESDEVVSIERVASIPEYDQ